MEPESSLPSWPEDLPDDEFSNFLEFGMPFADLNAGQQRQQSLPPRSLGIAPPSSGVQSTANASSSVSPFDFPGGSGQQDASQGPSASGLPVSAFPTSGATITPGFYVPEDQQQQQQQQQSAQATQFKNPAQSHYAIPHGQTVIPPTPNSIELHGGAARYPRVDENDMYQEQAYYTPLISPAMTPLETQFRLPEYTIPGEYFTPLTSPALEAQNSNNAYQVPEMGFVQSPGDNPSSPGIARKHRRGPSTNNRFSARAKKQQSPSVRPQARKKSLLGVNSDEVFNGLSNQEDGSKSNHGGNPNVLRLGSNESSQDSVSPEPLSDPLMPPPAIPQARKSPSIAPQSAAQNAPATPAMLMRIQRSQQQHHHHQSQDSSTGQFMGHAKLVPDTDDTMTDISLPEAAAPVTTSQSVGPRPKMARIDTAIPAGVPTPAASTNATPALEPKSAPIVSRNQPPSIAPSPRSLAMPSPSGPVAKKSDTPNLGPSNSRKRPSLSSAQPSPQLRPKISPNIQPLAPRGDETSALYLASKSNYQHILDGTLLPGVSYPETLAENLSSKRTNHKLAEQGRRNRINHALKEIETLIPEDFAQMRIAKEAAACNVKPSDKEKEKAGNQAISKASTVEMAIDYIKALQLELTTTKTKLADYEAQAKSTSGSDAAPGSACDSASGSASVSDTAPPPAASGQ